jgi:hypothetical protein
MPPKNVKFSKPKIAPVKVPHQPPIYEAPIEDLPAFEPKPKAVEPKPKAFVAKPKAVEFKPLPKPVQPAAGDSNKILNSMWFHVALIAIAALGLSLLFFKIQSEARQTRVEMGRLDVDLQTLQLQVKNTNDRVVKLQETIAELSSGIVAPTVTPPTKTAPE